MENPFEMIMEKLNSIEDLVRQMKSNSPTVPQAENGVQEIMNMTQAAAYISISKATMYKHTSTREIPHFKTGKRIYFKKTEIDQWLTKHKVMTRDEIEREADKYLMKHKRKW